MKIQLPKLYTQIGNLTPIGNSNINAIGCLTVLASMTSTYFGHPIDPSTLAKSVKYVGNLWNWLELTRLNSEIIYKGQIQTPNDLTDFQMNQIRDLINRGYPVFLQIKTPTLPEHWILAVDYVGDDFQCADPLTNPPKVHPITNFGIAPRKVIYAYAWYEGKVPQSVPLEDIEKLKAKIKDLEATEERLKKDNGRLGSEIDNLKSKLATVQNDANLRLNNYKSKILQFVQAITI